MSPPNGAKRLVLEQRRAIEAPSPVWSVLERRIKSRSPFAEPGGVVQGEGRIGRSNPQGPRCGDLVYRPPRKPGASQTRPPGRDGFGRLVRRVVRRCAKFRR
jgi:hypothetical protein